MFSKRLADKIKTNFVWSVISENGERIPGPEELSEDPERNNSNSDAFQEEKMLSVAPLADVDPDVECADKCDVAERVEIADSVPNEPFDSPKDVEDQVDPDSIVRPFAVVGSWDDEDEESNTPPDHAEEPSGTISAGFVPVPCGLSGEIDELFDNSKRIFRAKDTLIKPPVEEKEEPEKEPEPQRPNVAFRTAATNRSTEGNILGTVLLPSEMIESSIFLSEPIISRTVSFLSESGPESEVVLEVVPRNAEPATEHKDDEKRPGKKAISIEFRTKTDKDRKTKDSKKCG